MNTKHDKKRLGFTLIEIMVVLAILGLLFALVGPNIFKQQGVAKIQATKIQLKYFVETIRLHNNEHGKYPVSLQELFDKQDKKEPVPKDAWGEDYVYEPEYGDDGERVVDFNLFSMGPDRRKDTADDIGNKRNDKKDDAP
jgi:general secretion pathway protein G